MDSRPNQDLFTLNPLPSWIYDCETLEIIEVNRAAIDHYGYSKSEFLSLTLKHLRPAAEIPKLMQVQTDTALRSGNINFGIFTHQKKSGELIRMEINGHKMDYQDRQCMLAVCLDVTEKERQVQLLKDADEKLKSISAMAKIGYWRQDLDGTALTWTDEVFNIWERDKDSFEVNFENFVATIHPDDVEGFFKEQKAAFAGKKSLDVVHRIILPDQRIKWVHELGRFIKDQDGKAISFEGTVQDITDRKEEEQRLKLLESVITNTNDAILITEAEPFDEPGPRIIYVNEAFTKMTGYSAEEVIGKTPRILQGPNSDQVELKRLSKAIRNWESCEVTTPNYKKNGEEFWVNFKVTPVANKTGSYTHWIAIERDVTERKRIEEKLIKSKEIAEENEYRMREAQKLAHLGSWYYDVVNQVSQWSEETYNIWGLNPDLTPVNLIDHEKLVHPKDWERFNAIINNAIEKGIPYKMELELVRSDGTYKTVNTIGAPIFDENNKVIAFKGTTQDISERKKAEEENKFKANLLGMIGQAVIATNLDGVVNFWNKAAEEIYGWKQEEALGKNILHLTPNEASAAQATQLMEMLKKEQSWSGQFDVRKKDGTYFPAHVTNSPIYDENNILTGIIGISSDITQEVKNKELLRQYTLQLERSNEELEQFAFITSHDLQEPLRMITSFMDQLKRKYGDQLDEKAHQYIHFATDGAIRMKQIILDLLEYSRAGKSTDSMEQIDLNEILSDFNKLRRKVISEKSVTISTSYLPTIFSYKIAVTQVLHSLLDNAIKYSKKGIAPHIQIKTFEKRDEWIFAVRDNGIGIDSVFHDKIFILFQRLHNRHEYDGTGIGLSIAKKQVEFWGGKIWLESTPGEGSTFYFTLPKS